MTEKLKLSVAALALISVPAFASAESLAVSLSATFDDDANTVDGELDLTNDTADVTNPTSLSLSVATGANAAASTAGVTVEGTADATFANSGGGQVAVSDQEGNFENDNYTSEISFGAGSS